jgi:hypothetical protein
VAIREEEKGQRRRKDRSHAGGELCYERGKTGLRVIDSYDSTYEQMIGEYMRKGGNGWQGP